MAIENTLENRNALKAEWINLQAVGDESWKEKCREWNEMEKEFINQNFGKRFLKAFEPIKETER